jgi:hypothetical protein
MTVIGARFSALRAGQRISGGVDRRPNLYPPTRLNRTSSAV